MGQSYLRSMTRVENIFGDFSVHFIKARSNWNSWWPFDNIVNAFDRDLFVGIIGKPCVFRSPFTLKNTVFLQ